jgi:hypothetical protein
MTIFKKIFLSVFFALLSCAYAHPSYAQPQPCAQATDSQYYNADQNLDVLFKHPQIIFVPSTNVTVDNFRSWSNATPCPNNPWADPVLFAAAQSYINHVAPSLKNPFQGLSNNNGALSLDALIQLDTYSTANSSVATLRKELTYELYRRVACPAGVTLHPIGAAGPDCHTLQVNECHLLKDKLSDPSSGTATSNYGHAINKTGRAEVDGALADCDQNGLSLQAAEEAWAHRCGDSNHTAAAAGTKQSMAEHEKDIATCIKEAEEYDARVEQRKAFLHSIIQQKEGAKQQ